MTPASLLLPIALFLPAQVPDTGPGGIVAVVGNDVITKSELDRRLQREMLAYGGPSPAVNQPRFRRTVLKWMVDDVLILQEASRLTRAKDGKDDDGALAPGLEAGYVSARRAGESSWEEGIRSYVTDAEVDRRIEERMEQLREAKVNVTSVQSFYDFMRRTSGLEREELRAEIRQDVAIKKYLWNNVFRRIDTFVAPSESRYYYQRHLDEFRTPVSVTYRTIFLVYDRFNTPVVRRLIEKGLRDGESFEELAQKYSQDFVNPDFRGQPQTKSFAEIQEFYKAPIPDVLRSLEEGDVSLPPVAVGKNILYFYMEDRVEGTPKSYEEAQVEIEEKLKRERRDLAYRQLLDRLRDSSDPKVLLPELPEAPSVVEPVEDGEG